MRIGSGVQSASEVFGKQQNNSKTYYTYSNNETELYKIETQIGDIKDNEATTGKEEIDGKTYDYEEFNVLSKFYIGDKTNFNEESIKTRFYFKGNKLVYIKTIISNDNQQLLKVDYSEKVDSGLFEIPSDYKEM